MRTFILAAAVLLAPVSAQAQLDPSAQWLAWVGCWQSAVERLAGDTRLCVVPIDKGVEIKSVVGEEVTTVQRIVADNSIHQFDDQACKGTDRSEWSARSNMLFTQRELSCGSAPRQRVSVLSLMTAGPTWIEIQAVETTAEPVVRARRYERTPIPDVLANELPRELTDRAILASERLGAQAPTIADVVEASRKIATGGIEAMLFETKAHFALKSDNLIALTEAGIEERVIDLMLAISYPKYFAVNRQAPSVQPQIFQDPFGFYDDWDFGGPYQRWSMFAPYGFYYDGFGYSSWRIRYFPLGNSPAFFDSVEGVGAVDTSNSSSRAVKGQGYTRNVNRPSSTGDSSGSAATASTSSSGSRSGDSGGGSSASSGGYSSGGSGGGDSGGGRTAVDRN